jgi:RHS repeat-associated protein
MKKFYYILIIFAFSFCITAQTTPTGNSTEVGVTEGQLSVSLTGGATYAVPIEVPPGINGVVPQIGLVYNSQGGNGMAGYGWNISGVSAITRIPSTKFHDNTIDAVDFDALDRFAFDGQRLILKSGTYGIAGAVYETENFSNLKITSYGTHPSGANFGPAYFIVEYPDGSKAQYGNSIDSRSITDWAITYWENPQGVRISYSYISANNNLSIEYIKYGATFTNTPINQVKFVYKPRQRPEQAYIGGQSVIRNNILSEIQITGNGGVGFRYYVLKQDPSSLLYERLTSITEKSSTGISYNPTVFTYDTTNETILFNPNVSTVSASNISLENSATLSGDFDGDAKIDFLMYRTTGTDAKNKYWLFNDIGASSNTGVLDNIGSFDEIFATSLLTANNKMLPSQGWCVVKNNSFKVFTKGTVSTSTVVFQYEKNVSFPMASSWDCKNCANTPSSININKKYINGDFNGDGLTDVLALDIQTTVASSCAAIPHEPQDCRPVNSTIFSKKTYFVDLDRRKTTDFMNYAGDLLDNIGSTDKILASDVNGDGKTDVLHVSNGWVKVYSLNDSKQLVLLFTAPDSVILIDKPFLLGDYNGDGKADFMIPKGYGKNFALFTSTGTNYVKTEMTYNFEYAQNDVNNTRHLIPNDINSDGKTDMSYAITAIATPGSGLTGGGITFNSYRNLGSDFAYSATSTHGLDPNIKAFPVPIFLDADKSNQNLEMAFLTDNKIFYFNFKKDFGIEKLLRTITTGNGVKETISYSSIDKDTCTYNCHPVYTASEGIENYPNVDISVAPAFKVVAKLEKQSATVYKKQLYAYNGAVSNAEGLGFLGFRSTMSTNWHANDSDIISSISKFDMTQRGANIENYTVLYLHDPLTTTSSFQTTRIITKGGNGTDYIVTGPENLVATQRITLKPNTWIQPGSAFSAKIAPEANASSNTPIDFITKSILTYESDLLSNKVFKIQNTISKQYNALENTNSETTTVYDTYNNPTQSTTLLKAGGATVQTSVSNVTYDNQPTASPYYIGRPINKTQSVAVNGDTMTSEEQYFYTNHLLTQIKKKGNNTDFITEDNIYDTFGNIKTKTIAATGLTPRVTNYVYDPTGRFLKTSSDIESLITTFDYNLSSGVLNFEINPYGLKTTYEYDSWFKKTKTIDYLGKSNTYVYTRNGSFNTLVTTTGDDGSASQELFDDLGRKTTSGVKDITGIMSNVDYYYDIYDRNFKVSEPYNSGSASQFNITEYDVYGRVFKSTSFTGKIVNITYSGLTTTVNDGSKTKISTKNAIGKVVSMIDSPGGTINYTYFANGNLKSSNYDGVTTTIEQDGWGRKTKLTDPSAGIYSYAYNGFGETTSETTPNGSTIYELDNFGKLKKKTISGTNTNTVSDYVYDGSSKLLLSSTFNDIKEGTLTNYTYNYDSSKRIISTIESTPFYGTTFTKLVSYDLFGRVEYETSTAALGGKSSAKKIKNVYKNGSPWQIIDDVTQIVLWQTSEVNARGQLTKATLGNGIDIINKYDQYGFSNEFKHDKTGGTPFNVMTLTTHFDEKKGNLKDRTNSLFTNGLEVFEYDALDRLTKYPNALGQQITQDYDARGRITQNTLGTYSYANSSKPYQNTQVELAPLNVNYYKGRPTQNITYNVFKSPVQIEEVGKDKISFTYNDDNNRSAMFYGGLQDDKSMRTNRKYYSSDGSMEIKYNKGALATEFITYIGGDGYTAPIVLKSDGITQNYLYLHRDYQGSIVAITNASGVVVEKRLFDAWGAIIKVQDGAGNTLAGLTILDRGYTGHEHLQSVGLINMNGRIYDPKLHRFLQADNNVQDPFNTQNYNRYGYVLNNPLKYTDPSGEFIWLPVIIGAIIGAYSGGTLANNGEFNPTKWDYSSGKTWGYMIGGAIVGGISGGVANSIATSGVAGANTLAIMAGSAINSVGTFAYTGGQTDLSVFFGIGSFNFSTGEFGYLGKSGNSFMENLGYGLGAVANVSDALAGMKPGQVQLNTEHSDAIGHSALTKVGETDGFNSLVSVGPDVTGKGIFDPLNFQNKAANWHNYVDVNGTWKKVVEGVNLKSLANYSKGLANGAKYNLYFSSCVNHTARALTLAGVPVLGIHPFILNAEIYLRNIGFRPSLFSYHLQK